MQIVCYRSGHTLARVGLLSVMASLAGCGYDHCGNCYVTPQEVAVGVVAGNFLHNGQDSVISTSTVLYGPGFNPGNLKVYPQTAAGSFGSPVLVPAGYDPLYLASADLNGDSLLDVVSASFKEGSLSVFFNSAQSPGSFGPRLVLSSPGASQVAIGDLNGDGIPDLVSADFYVSLFMQSSPGTFANPVSLYAGGANWVAIGDLNGDGAADVALTDAVGVKVLFHTGAATSTTFAAPVSVFTQTPNAQVLGDNIIGIADVNADGFNDLVITDPGPTGGATQTVSVLLQDATHPGQFLPAVSYPTAPNSYAMSILVKDVNGDGHPDIVIGGTGAVSVLLQDPANAGTFLAASNYSVFNATEIALGDTNGDGLLDIIVPNGPSTPTVNGVITNTAGVLLQSATSPGTYGALQALP